MEQMKAQLVQDAECEMGYEESLQDAVAYLFRPTKVDAEIELQIELRLKIELE